MLSFTIVLACCAMHYALTTIAQANRKLTRMQHRRLLCNCSAVVY